MSEEKKKKINPGEEIGLITFNGVKVYKSVRRAIRRGHLSPRGIMYPKRPFNNRKGRPLEEKKKVILQRIKKQYGRELR